MDHPDGLPVATFTPIATAPNNRATAVISDGTATSLAGAAIAPDLTIIAEVELTAVALQTELALPPPTLPFVPATPLPTVALPTVPPPPPVQPSPPPAAAPAVPAAPAPTLEPIATAQPVSQQPTVAALASPTREPYVTPTVPPFPDVPPELPGPSFNACQPDPVSLTVPNYPVKIITVDKETEVITIQNISPGPVDLRGWSLCSIQGGEQYSGFDVTLESAQTVRVVYPSAAIWNNDQQDDAALYNANGQLVSYWSDPN
jgi:hypothetical protein